MAWNSTTGAEMDAAAAEAAQELARMLDTGQVTTEALDALAAWWARHYMAAGHKRLGRQLVTRAKAKTE